MKSKKALTWSTLIIAVLTAIVIVILFASIVGHGQIIDTLVGDIFGR